MSGIINNGKNVIVGKKIIIVGDKHIDLTKQKSQKENKK